jgi:hypothetical protein
MLYHELGDEGPTDPYELPEVSAFAVSQGLDADAYRDSIKWVMQVIINGRGRIGQAKRPTDLESVSELMLSVRCGGRAA